MKKTLNIIPEGCHKYINHQKIIEKDINHDRPFGVSLSMASCEGAIKHSLILMQRKKIFRKPYWSVFTTTSYEMCYNNEAWAETDLTGLEWQFHNYKDAENFLHKES